ncbi:DUF11 domain-containing protein, partial [Candidatus Kuenenbacteria bacterium]|nr:DUF11 domain-containing protein [Candidatus Kuenenbacteria bacterium]
PTYEVAITKSAPATAYAGDEITYTIDWSVTGNALASNVTIVDTLPAGVNLLSVSGISGSYSSMGNTYTFVLGDKMPPANGTIELLVKISNSAVDGDVLVNNVTITSGDKNADDSASTTILGRYDYTVLIDKVAPAEVNAGENITYNIDWSVAGNKTAPAVVVTDTLAANATFVSASENGVYDEATRTVVWQLGAVDAGTVTTPLQVVVSTSPDANDGEEVVNNVVIKSESKEASDSATTIIKKEIIYDHEVSIEKSAPAEINAGDGITYTLDWNVTGNETAPDVTVIDSLPANVTFVSASDSGTYDEATRKITWLLGDKQPGDNGTLTVVVSTEAVSLTDGETITNNVEIRSGLKTDTDSAITIVKKGGSTDHDVNITKSAPASINAGESINYTINWNCTGNETCVDVIVTDTLPDKVNFVSASDNGVYSTTTRTIVWQLGNKQPGNSGTLTVAVGTNAGSLTNGETITNNVKIQSGSKTATSTTTTTVFEEGNLVPGVKLEYDYPLKKTNGYSYAEQIRVINNGQVTLTNGALWIDLNEKILEMESTDKATVLGDVKKQMFKWSIPTLAPGETYVLNFVVHAFDQDVYHLTDTYVAYFSDQADAKTKGSEWVICPDVWYRRGEYDMSRGVGSTAPSATYQGQAPKRTTPLDPPVIKPVAVVTPTSATVKSEVAVADILALTYTYAQTKELGGAYLESVTMKNTGTSELTNGFLTVNIPSKLINFVSAMPNWDNGSKNEETATWKIDSLAAGEETTIKFTVAAKAVGVPTTKVTAVFDQVTKKVSWTENINAPKTAKSSVIVAPATTSTLEVIPPKSECPKCQACATCQTGACANCGWWLWLIIILIHILVLFVYYFFEAKEDMKQDEAGEYYIIKGNKGWMLPVFMALLVVFLLLYLVCAVGSWWALALILACYYLALVSNHFLIHKVEMKYGPFFPLLITLAVLIAYLICHSWYWWVLTAVIVFYVLTLGTYYFMVIKMNRQSRSYWWLAPLFATALIIVLEMVLRMCHCGEVIK